MSEPPAAAPPAPPVLPLRVRLARALWENPVLVKELRTRMRGTRAYWILFAYTLAIGGILALLYLISQQAGGQAFRGDLRYAGELGRSMFAAVFVMQAVMVGLITPAITSGAITIEREQRSYELLATTPLRPADLVRGKLLAAVSFSILLLTVTLPLVSLSFLVGGVSPGEIAACYLVVAASAFLYGAVGLFWSATLRTTAAATVASYLTSLGLFLATAVPGIVAQERSWIGSGSGAAPDVPFQSLNPLMVTFRGVHTELWFGLEVPSWVGATVLLVLAGMLATQMAMARLEHFVPPRPGWTRALATLTWGWFAFLLAGPIIGGFIRMGLPSVSVVARTSEALTELLVTGAILLTFLGVALNTGEPAAARPGAGTSGYLAGLLPHRLLGAELPNGLPLALLWALVFVAIPPLGLILSGNAALLRPAEYGPGAAVVVAVIFGLAGAGHALTGAARSRWQALTFTLVLAGVLMALPYGVLGALVERGMRSSPLWVWLYAVPFEAVTEAAGLRSGAWPGVPPLPIRPLWPFTIGLYLLIGVTGLCVTAIRRGRPAAQSSRTA